MQRQDKSLEDILEFLMKQRKAEEKIRQEWAKISIHGYNPYVMRDRTLNGGFFTDGGVNRLPSSLIYNYGSRKTGLQDYELQKLYLPLPEHPVTLSTANSNRMNQGWGSSVAVWIAAILVMGILVFLIRATEKCLEKRLFKIVRRTSEEWTTPSVIATSQQVANNGDLGNTLRVDIPAFQLDNQDLPPPYSDCTSDAVPNSIDPKYVEEPPPPYAACFVAYTAPKDIEPSVHIITDIHKAGTSRSDSSVGNVELATLDVETNHGRNENGRTDATIVI